MSYLLCNFKLKMKLKKRWYLLIFCFTVSFSFPEKPCPLQPKHLGLGLDIARKTPSEKYEAFGSTFIFFSVKVEMQKGMQKIHLKQA